MRGKKVDLTAKEFEILALLASNPGQAFTRGQIYEHIWGRDSSVDDSSITVFMRKIREKIEDNPYSRNICSVWRVDTSSLNECRRSSERPKPGSAFVESIPSEHPRTIKGPWLCARALKETPHSLDGGNHWTEYATPGVSPNAECAGSSRSLLPMLVVIYSMCAHETALTP